MADITEDLLQTLAAGDPIAMLLVATTGKPVGRELRAIAAELLAARNKIRADEEHLPTIGRLTQDLHETEQELLAARARIAKLEQEPTMAMVDFGVGFNWKGLHEDMQRLRAERDAARAQLREVAASGVEAKCRQYVTVQIDPETWRKIQEVARG